MGLGAWGMGRTPCPVMNLSVVDLGTMAYGAALELQRAAAHARISKALPDDLLLLVEHPPVVTLGRGTKPGHLMASEAQLRARGVELFEVERGGDITFHGPGQLVGYPIIDLKEHRQDLHWYLRQVEESLMQAMASLGLPCERNQGYTGVWTRGIDGRAESRLRKVASIGVHARDWVTWHGFALNVTTDLSYFDLIVPCGISDVTMTTVRRELGVAFRDEHTVRAAVVDSFASVFGMSADPRSAHSLDGLLAGVAPGLTPG
jgi:lipoyl(octanoyl) transferase